MSNVPQDVIDDAKAAVREITGDPIMADGVSEDDARLMLKFAQLRAQRSNAEPVMFVRVDALARLQKWGQLNMVGYNHPIHSPKPVIALYTAPPDYDAGFAAGMMKAAEICLEEQVDYEATHDTLDAAYNVALDHAATAIKESIPADSKAALREVCMKVAKAAIAAGMTEANHECTGREGIKRADAEAIVNSVLEGKS